MEFRNICLLLHKPFLHVTTKEFPSLSSSLRINLHLMFSYLFSDKHLYKQCRRRADFFRGMAIWTFGHLLNSLLFGGEFLTHFYMELSNHAVKLVCWHGNLAVLGKEHKLAKGALSIWLRLGKSHFYLITWDADEKESQQKRNPGEIRSSSLTTCLRKRSFYVVVVHLLSHVWFFVTPWTSARQAPLAPTILEFAQIHVHWVSDAI